MDISIPKGRSIEYLWVVSLNTKNWVTNLPCRQAGRPSEIFRVPIYKAAVNIILVHNPRLTGRGRHPSGSLMPSPVDKDFTDKMMKVGKLLNIAVVDHQIITETDFYSFVPN